MALHVTQKKVLFDSVSVAVTTSSTPFATAGFIEGRIFITATITQGTYTPVCEQQNPQSGAWFTRSDISLSAMTTASAQQMVAFGNLGSRMRLTWNVTSPAAANLSVVFEGKS